MLGDSGFKRVDGDIYYTEPWVTQALLDRIRFRGVIWEPACGRGDMVKVIGAAGYEVLASDIAGDDLGCGSAVRVDFLRERHKSSRSFSIVTNPPYRLAEEFIRHALELTEPGRGMVAMLLRNEYDCAAGRRDLFERRCFAAKFVLTRRPRWIDGGHTASPRHNFAWFLWDHGHSGTAAIEWLPRKGKLVGEVAAA